ncbi:hypothetical protein HX773_24650 [Pantoea sp. B9002]|uniref:hypothetical protein n=1 Tax=Pantoea sp. B9002 TaxID=2726979 RepID=UPI0015A47701|nr:hypothetical protein [Pantoea sp. B9002]NWA64092.1 hypothetical protein [Pantoea sp. B9002]
MSDKEKEDRILKETQNLFSLRSDYENARSNYRSEMRRDSERSDGSYAQEARREAHQNELRDAEHSAKSALDAQERLISSLTKDYLS